MKVLKHGNTYREKECPGCGALLSYCETDIKSNHYKDYDNFKDHWLTMKYIKCPECNGQINLKFFVDGEEQKL